MATGDGIRYNIAGIDPTERALFSTLLGNLNQKVYPGAATDSPPGGVSYWFKLDEIAASAGSIFNSPFFLPWNRQLLLETEAQLRQINRVFSMHYWDWKQDPRAITGADLGSGNTGLLNIFSGDYMGYGGPVPDTIGSVWQKQGLFNPAASPNRDGPGGNAAYPPLAVQRFITGQTISAADEQTLLQAPDYPTFWPLLWNLFQKTYRYLYTGSTGFQFRDPMILPLLSNVDRLFALWQCQSGHPERLSPATLYGALGTQMNQLIQPWGGGSKVRPWSAPEQIPEVITYLSPMLVTPSCYDTNYVQIPANFSEVFKSGNGIGGYDLSSVSDLSLAFDFDGSGKLDHLIFYRPGAGAIYILKNQGGTFSAVYSQGDPGSGIGGYDLQDSHDRVIAFDYNSSGKQDHLVLYRAGSGTVWILQNQGGVFSCVFKSTSGIGGYDLSSTADVGFAFDYDGSGKLDHLVFYRPGAGAIFILKNQGGTFSAVYNSQSQPVHGIGGYDLMDSHDSVFAYDYNSSGKQDHLVLYRAGSGTVWILQNQDGVFSYVFKSTSGIGGYDLSKTADVGFAFDYDGSGKLDYLVFYRPGTGAIYILKNLGGTFSAVYAQGDPGSGIGGYDLQDSHDKALAFDFDGSGKQDHLTLYRSGSKTAWILKHSNS